MCGIIGYVGLSEKTKNVLYNGLKSLEYRGYDSSGICFFENNRARIIKSKGKLENLNKKLKNIDIKSNIGIGHTRWATHGEPSELNAHPHCSGPVSVVHNGIIENFSDLKEELIQDGYEFISDTDSEVLAHLINQHYQDGNDLEDSVRSAFKRVVGSYAVAIMSENEPDKIIATRSFSPLIISQNGGEYFLASDLCAILPHSNNVLFLEEKDFAIISENGIKITDQDGSEVDREYKYINWDPVTIEKAGYRHFMLKEIHEQPRAVLDTLRGKFNDNYDEVFLDGINEKLLNSVNRIVIVACGTSYHASLIGKYMLESVAKINTQVELASEFKYRQPVLDNKTLLIAVSQSGETADTSEALGEAKNQGLKSIGITNVELSKIARETDFLLNTKAGPEIGVASTKAFTTQVLMLYLLSIRIGLLRKVLDKDLSKSMIRDATAVPRLQQEVLDMDEQIRSLSKEFYHYKNFIYLGRGVNYPVALEGALKLKEISYIHAEGYAAGEMKHGPIALIDENMPVVFIAPDDQVYYKKLLNNFKEIKARGGRIIFITSNKDIEDLLDKNDRKILIPSCSNLISPLITVLPVQFLAYHIAFLLGTDIDQPRNLAKVVTVE